MPVPFVQRKTRRLIILPIVTFCVSCARRYYRQISLDHYPLHCLQCDALVDWTKMAHYYFIPTWWKFLTRLAELQRSQYMHAIYQCPHCYRLHNVMRVPFVYQTQCNYCSTRHQAVYFLTKPAAPCRYTTRYAKAPHHCFKCNVYYLQENNHQHQAMPWGIPVIIPQLLQRLEYWDKMQYQSPTLHQLLKLPWPF